VPIFRQLNYIYLIAKILLLPSLNPTSLSFSIFPWGMIAKVALQTIRSVSFDAAIMILSYITKPPFSAFLKPTTKSTFDDHVMRGCSQHIIEILIERSKYWSWRMQFCGVVFQGFFSR
jgi:hypothetical protein